MTDITIGTKFKGPLGKTWTVTGFQGQYVLTKSGKLTSCINTAILRQHFALGGK